MVKIKLNTKEFSKMLSKVSKASVHGGVDMLAELVEIKLNNGTLSLRTTDTRNTMILRKTGVVGDDFSAVINIELFEKVVAKTGREEIELIVTDAAVELVGNGSYKFALTIEGDQAVTLPPIAMLSEPDFKTELTMSQIKSIIDFNGGFIGSQFVDPTISGYHFSDNVVTTDGSVCCFYHDRLFPQPLMLYPSTIALLNEFEDEKIIVAKKGKRVQIYSASGFIDTVAHVDSDEFPLEELSAYLNNNYDSGVQVSKKDLQESLDRVMLFVDQKNEFGATCLDFKDDGIHISDRQSRAHEVIPYKNSDKFKPFFCLVPAADLSKVIDIDGADAVTLWYDSDSAIRVDSRENTRIVALLNDSDMDMSEYTSESNDSEVGDDIDIGEPPVTNEFGSIEDINW